MEANRTRGRMQPPAKKNTPDQVMHSSHHGPQDYQSLLMHREAVRMILAEPALADKALAILARWDTHASLHSKPLRQASPMACLLPTEVRLGIIAQARLRAPNG